MASVSTYSDGQIAQLALKSGLNSEQAKIATAVALAESGGQVGVAGDVSLQNGTWGISYGLWQVRTLRSPKDNTRNLDWLKKSVENQATAMYTISSGGKNWQPWTTYTKGTYKKYLARATVAVEDASNGKVTSTSPNPGVYAPGENPLSSIKESVTDPLSSIGSSVSSITSLITKRSFWIRFAEVLAGIIVILIVLASFVRSNVVK